MISTSSVVNPVLCSLEPVVNSVSEASYGIVDQLIAIRDEVATKFLDLQSVHEPLC